MKSRFLSTALIVAGCLCVAAPFAIEAFQYPWRTVGSDTVNELELSDPPPPEIDFVDYADLEPEELPSAAPEVIAMPAFEETPDDPEPSGDAPPEATPGPTAAPAPPRPRYVRLGSVKIPRLDVSENLFSGTQKQMRYGVGHLEGTPLPGAEGNAVVAAHRIYPGGKQPFRYLDKMQNGDVVTVSVGDETFRYEVYDMFIVHRDETWVLHPVRGEKYVLTMITCDPVVSAGDRENRLIVRARLT